MALSPTETATEMYRNSIANVRKSGKQAAAGPQTTTQASKTDKGEVNAAITKMSSQASPLKVPLNSSLQYSCSRNIFTAVF